jgi:hypothetical protein
MGSTLLYKIPSWVTDLTYVETSIVALLLPYFFQTFKCVIWYTGIPLWGTCEKRPISLYIALLLRPLFTVLINYNCMLTPNNLYSNIDEICPSWVRFHFRQNMQNSAGRNINSTTTSLIFVQPLNNVINSSYLRPNFFALCLAVKDDLDIVEWIEYHWRKGCSNSPLSHLIRQYIDKSIYIVEEMKPSPQMHI